jgi:hypothetical protein
MSIDNYLLHIANDRINKVNEYRYDNHKDVDTETFIYDVKLNSIHHNDLVLPPTPKDITEAIDMNNPHRDEWIQAITDELNNLTAYDTIRPTTETGRSLKTKFVFTVSFKADYTIKFKARLVVCGYSQREGIDYFDTFSPTTNMLSIMILMFIGAHEKTFKAEFDISAAFLEGRADVKQFAMLPKEISKDGISERVEITGNWYGTKQAPKIWYTRLSEILLNLGFKRCPWDQCLFMSRDDDGTFIMISIHVDDGWIISNTYGYIEMFISQLQQEIKKVSLFYLNPNTHDIKYLGMNISEITQYRDINTSQLVNIGLPTHMSTEDAELSSLTSSSVDSVIVTQYMELSLSDYINDKLDDYPDSSSSRKQHIPMSNTANLRTEVPNENNPPLSNIIGKFRYLCDRTRYDILTAVGEVSTGGSPHPSNKHVIESKHIYNYLKQHRDRNLLLGGGGPIEHFCFTDASYITAGNSKSRLGGCQFLGADSGAIQCWSNNDTTVSHSSMESEIKALDLLIMKAIKVRNIMSFLGFDLVVPTKIYMDNMSAIELCKTLKSNHKVNHINMKINYIRECINNKLIEIRFIPSERNVADVLTKPLAHTLFKQHVMKLMYGFNNNLNTLGADISLHSVMYSIELRNRLCALIIQKSNSVNMDSFDLNGTNYDRLNL